MKGLFVVVVVVFVELVGNSQKNNALQVTMLSFPQIHKQSGIYRT